MRDMRIAVTDFVSLEKCNLSRSSPGTCVDWAVGISQCAKHTARQSIFYLERMHSLLAAAGVDEDDVAVVGARD